MSKILSTFLIFLLFFLFSCSTTEEGYRYAISPDPEVSFYEVKYDEKFKDIIKPLCKHIRMRNVFVADVVDYKSLKPNKESLFLTEYLKSSVSNQCKSKILQIEFTKNIILKNSGVIVLSRNFKKIKNKSIKTNYLIVGTYKKTDTHVILFLRLIDVKTGKIKEFKTKQIRYYSPFYIKF